MGSPSVRDLGAFQTFEDFYFALNERFISGELGLAEGCTLPRLYDGTTVASVTSPMETDWEEMGRILFDVLGFKTAKLRVNRKKYHDEERFQWTLDKLQAHILKGDRDFVVFPYECPFNPGEYRTGTNDRGPCMTTLMVNPVYTTKSEVTINFEVHFRASEVTSRLLPDIMLLNEWVTRCMDVATGAIESSTRKKLTVRPGRVLFHFTSLYQSMYLVQVLWDELNFRKREWGDPDVLAPHLKAYLRYVRDIHGKLWETARTGKPVINLKRKYTPVRRTYQATYISMCTKLGRVADRALLGKPKTEDEE